MRRRACRYLRMAALDPSYFLKQTVSCVEDLKYITGPYVP